MDDLHRRSGLALARQRAPAHVAQPPADDDLRLDVDEEQLLLEPRRPRDHRAFVVQHARVAVEDQLVLPADRVAEGDEARIVAGARDEHLLALDLLADVERRGADVHEQLRSRQREVGRGRPGLPHVLADRDADERAAQLQQDEVAARSEVAVLVEDAVVRQEALAVDRLDGAVRADGARVVEVVAEVGEAHERHDVACVRGDLLERARRGGDESGPQEQILRRVAGHGQLGEEDEIRVSSASLVEAGEDQLAVPVEIADDGVDLCKREPHGFRLSV